MADDKKHAEIDAALVRQLAEILNETDLTEVEVERILELLPVAVDRLRRTVMSRAC